MDRTLKEIEVYWVYCYSVSRSLRVGRACA
jgi:hypothetical protein